MKSFELLFLFLIVVACERLPENTDRKPDPLFSTTAPSRLYFKNMRSFYYRQSTKPETKIDLYTLKKIPEKADRPLLIPIIADNWLQDEAYLLLEPNDHPAWRADTLNIKWEDPKTGASGAIAMANPNILMQLDIAGFLEMHLNSGHRISFLSQNNDWQPLFTQREDISNFLTTTKDYVRLTEQELKKQRK